MLLNHHREFLTAVRKKQVSVGSITKNETAVDPKDLCLSHINIGQEFSAVSGIFSDHAFLDYLYQQSTVEYVEPNQIYKTTEIKEKKRSVEDYEEEERLQRADIYSLKSTKPANWGLARINQRQKSNFDEYIFDSEGG